MKYKYLLILPLLAAITSCSIDDGDDIEITFAANQMNLVYADDGSEPSTLQVCNYNFKNNQSKGLMSISVQDLAVGKKTISFTTSEMAYTQTGEGFTFSSMSVPCQDAEITSFRAQLLTSANVPPQIVGGPVTFGTVYQLVACYAIDNFYTVRTFPTDATYTGSTKIDTESFENIVYRVRVKSDGKTADVYVYNFRTSEKAEVQNFKLTDLSLVPDGQAYRVEGSNLTAKDPAGVDMQNLVFDKFTLKTLSADLTSVKIDYEMSGSLTATFQGSYLYNIK